MILLSPVQYLCMEENGGKWISTLLGSMVYKYKPSKVLKNVRDMTTIVINLSSLGLFKEVVTTSSVSEHHVACKRDQPRFCWVSTLDSKQADLQTHRRQELV